MKRASLFLIALFFSVLSISAQDYTFITELPDDFSSLDTIPPVKVRNSVHMLGVKYGVNLSGVKSTPPIGEYRIFTKNNISVLYTYYHTLWGYMSNFGVQFGVHYGEQGYGSEYSAIYGETCKVVEVPLISQFHIDFSRFRILANLGGYGGYRLSTDKAGGFDQFDQRYDYGIVGGAGFAVIFKPFEIQLEGNYQYSFASMYQTNKISDLYWMLTYPRNIMISASLFVHLW